MPNNNRLLCSWCGVFCITYPEHLKIDVKDYRFCSQECKDKWLFQYNTTKELWDKSGVEL